MFRSLGSLFPCAAAAAASGRCRRRSAPGHNNSSIIYVFSLPRLLESVVLRLLLFLRLLLLVPPPLSVPSCFALSMTCLPACLSGYKFLGLLPGTLWWMILYSVLQVLLLLSCPDEFQFVRQSTRSIDLCDESSVVQLLHLTVDESTSLSSDRIII